MASHQSFQFGQSPLSLQMQGFEPHLPGLSMAQAESAWKKLHARFDSGEIGFYQTPIQQQLSQAAASESLAKELLSRGTFTDCLFLGIGGSSLGPMSLIQALQERRQTKLRFHFQENPDALDWKATLAHLNPEKTLVVCVTKSGTTFETVSQLLCALEWLGPKLRKTHVVCITDPQKGDLRKWANAEGLKSLEIAPNVGGRFSVFTPVGLFAAALAGLSVRDFLRGAEEVREVMETLSPSQNPLFRLGLGLISLLPEKRSHVFMPYSTRLRLLGDWFVQLWGESIGKDGKGFNPMAALGATDQHSILQLLRDGPNDKVTFFVNVKKVADPVRIPKAPEGYPSFSILEGHTLHELLQIEQAAIAKVLTNQKRPHLSFELEEINERGLGAMYFALCVLTAFTGTAWDVNPFDQPGVEEGKVYILSSLKA